MRDDHNNEEKETDNIHSQNKAGGRIQNILPQIKYHKYFSRNFKMVEYTGTGHSHVHDDRFHFSRLQCNTSLSNLGSANCEEGWLVSREAAAVLETQMGFMINQVFNHIHLHPIYTTSFDSRSQLKYRNTNCLLTHQCGQRLRRMSPGRINTLFPLL